MHPDLDARVDRLVHRVPVEVAERRGECLARLQWIRAAPGRELGRQPARSRAVDAAADGRGVVGRGGACGERRVKRSERCVVFMRRTVAIAIGAGEVRSRGRMVKSCAAGRATWSPVRSRSRSVPEPRQWKSPVADGDRELRGDGDVHGPVWQRHARHGRAVRRRQHGVTATAAARRASSRDRSRACRRTGAGRGSGGAPARRSRLCAHGRPRGGGRRRRGRAGSRG